MVKRERKLAMKTFWILLTILMSCHLACGLRKTQLDNSSVLQKQELVKESTASAAFERNLFLSDSTSSLVMLHIKPKGVFSYSIKDGFVGEADELRIASTKVKDKTFEIAEKLDIENTISHVDTNELSAKTITKRVDRNGIKTAWFLAILFILSLLFILRKKLWIFLKRDNKLKKISS